MQLESSLSWLALGLTPGLASRLSARVLRRFDSPDGVFRATLSDLESCHLPAPVAQSIVKKEAFKRAEKELTGVQKIAGCSLLNWTEPEYPQPLLQIYDPPVMLYVRGDPQVLNLPSLGIVVCYPKENKKLYEKVLERGAIISEFPLRTHLAPENFPIRNRIVAGLPLGVVVEVGAQYSG